MQKCWTCNESSHKKKSSFDLGSFTNQLLKEKGMVLNSNSSRLMVPPPVSSSGLDRDLKLILKPLKNSSSVLTKGSLLKSSTNMQVENAAFHSTRVIGDKHSSASLFRSHENLPAASARQM